LISDLQDFYLFSSHGILNLIRKPFYFKDRIEQMDYAGPGSFVILLLVSLFICKPSKWYFLLELGPGSNQF